MAFPKLLQKLFQNSGAGSLLREDIIPVDSSLSTTSTNAVQNKVVKSAVDTLTTSVNAKLNTADLNTALTELITEYGGTVPS